jgi:ribosome-associated protein
VILDLRHLKVFTDYFVICHGTSGRHALAVADAVEERLAKELKREPGHVEGRRAAEWVLLDYIDFVVHVFTEEKRAYYSLERLWGDAPRLALPGEEARKAAPASSPATPRRRARKSG